MRQSRMASGRALLAVVIGIAGGSWWAEAREPAAAAEPLTVMSFNIRYGTAADGSNAWPNRRERVIRCIQNANPDLLGTQEMLAFQRDELADGLPGYTTVAAGRDDGREAGEMTGIFYRTARFEERDAGHFWLSPTPADIASKGWDAALPRIASWVRLRDRRQPEGRELLFLNTHFDHRGRVARRESARLIRRWLSEQAADCRVIVTGDFNAAEGSEPYEALFGDTKSEGDARRLPLLDTLRAVQPQRGPDEGTFTGFDASQTSGARIDWIGCSADWQILSAAIDRTSEEGRTPSDHAAVQAVLIARPASTTQQ